MLPWRESFAQSPLPPPSDEYVIRTWTIPDGLPQGSPTTFLQTSDGYLWVGTWNGLARFDGLKFTSFHSGNTPAIRNSKINVLYEDNGDLWIGTDGGLLRYHRGVFSAVDLGRNSQLEVTGIVRDYRGNLWIGTDSGLFGLDEKGIHVVDRGNKVFAQAIHRLAADSSGDLWLSLDEAVARVRVQGNSLVVKKMSSRYAMAVDDRGRVWYWDNNHVLHRTDNNNETLFRQFSGLPFTILWPLRDGAIGLCFQDRVILVGDRGITNLTEVGGVPLKENESIFEDREGNIWLGRASTGVSRLRKKTVTVIGLDSGLSSETISSVLEDRAGTLWVGTYRKGLNVLNKGKFHHYTDAGISSTSWINFLWERSDRTLWASTIAGGLMRLKTGTPEQYLHGIIQHNTTVTDACEDRSGGVWMATRSGGVQVDKNGSTTVWDTSHGLPSNEMTCLLASRNGDVWVGSSGGLDRIREGRLTVFTAQNGLTNDDVQTLLEDDDGAIWIGTRRGLNRWYNGVFQRLTEREGLVDDAIAEMVDDGLGYFWFGGIKGLFRIQKEDLREAAEGRTKYIRSSTYGTEAGLKIAEVGGGGNPRAWKGRDGTLWFESERGLIRVDPASVRSNPTPPNVVIERASVDGKAVRTDTSIVIGPQQTKVEYEFTGISFSSPERIRFQYKLTGLEETWQETEGRRFVQYTNLPSGTYTFQIRAANSDGVLNETGASLGLVVFPPFWRTTWFLAIVTVFFLFSGPTVYFLRVRTLKREQLRQQNFSRMLIERQENERNRISREMHDGVGQELLILKHRFQLTLREQSITGEMKELLEEQSAATSNIITEIRHISHDLRPPELDRLGVTEAIRAILQRIRSAQTIEVAGEIDDIDGFFRKEDEIHLVRILQESMNNILKHADASAARITLSLHRQGLTMSITDNGKGMDDPTSQSSGLGLTDIRERVQLMDGTMDITSTPGTGTTLMFNFSRKNSDAG